MMAGYRRRAQQFVAGQLSIGAKINAIVCDVPFS